MGYSNLTTIFYFYFLPNLGTLFKFALKNFPNLKNKRKIKILLFLLVFFFFFFLKIEATEAIVGSLEKNYSSLAMTSNLDSYVFIRFLCKNETRQ